MGWWVWVRGGLGMGWCCDTHGFTHVLPYLQVDTFFAVVLCAPPVVVLVVAAVAVTSVTENARRQAFIIGHG